MNEKQKQEWTTPSLIEYGDVAKLTEFQYKTWGSGDAFSDQLGPWMSGSCGN